MNSIYIWSESSSLKSEAIDGGNCSLAPISFYCVLVRGQHILTCSPFPVLPTWSVQRFTHVDLGIQCPPSLILRFRRMND